MVVLAHPEDTLCSQVRHAVVLLPVLVVAGGCGSSVSSLQRNRALTIIDEPVPKSLWQRLTGVSVIGVFAGGRSCFHKAPATRGP